MIRKTIATPTGRISILVQDGTRWREEALAAMCEQVLSQVLGRLMSRPKPVASAAGRRRRKEVA